MSERQPATREESVSDCDCADRALAKERLNINSSNESQPRTRAKEVDGIGRPPHTGFTMIRAVGSLRRLPEAGFGRACFTLRNSPTAQDMSTTSITGKRAANSQRKIKMAMRKTPRRTKKAADKRPSRDRQENHRGSCATGAQGGGLVRAILNDKNGPFTARAITRNANSEKAKALAEAGAEVVTADLDDVGSLKQAFQGAHGAFCVTNFWEHFKPEKELSQARNMAQAAKDAGVKHVIWSTLEDTRKSVPLSDDRMPTLRQIQGAALRRQGRSE